MGINENLKELEDTISSLEEAVKNAMGQDRDTIRDAISRLKVKKNTLAGSQWDGYKAAITDDDVKTLKDAKKVFEDKTKTEQEKADKVRNVVSIAKKIIGFLGV